MSIKLDNGFRGAILCQQNDSRKQKRYNVKINNDNILIYLLDRDLPIYEGKWISEKNCYIIKNTFLDFKKSNKLMELQVLDILHHFIIIKEYENIEYEKDIDNNTKNKKIILEEV
jgi:hypothetical protein